MIYANVSKSIGWFEYEGKYNQCVLVGPKLVVTCASSLSDQVESPSTKVEFCFPAIDIQVAGRICVWEGFDADSKIPWGSDIAVFYLERALQTDAVRLEEERPKFNAKLGALDFQSSVAAGELKTFTVQDGSGNIIRVSGDGACSEGLRGAPLFPADEPKCVGLLAGWRAPIGWSGLIVSASLVSGPSARCFWVLADDSPKRCAA